MEEEAMSSTASSTALRWVIGAMGSVAQAFSNIWYHITVMPEIREFNEKSEKIHAALGKSAWIEFAACFIASNRNEKILFFCEAHGIKEIICEYYDHDFFYRAYGSKFYTQRACDIFTEDNWRRIACKKMSNDAAKFFGAIIIAMEEQDKSPSEPRGSNCWE